MSNVLRIARRGETLNQITMGRRPVELGSSSDCDLQVDDHDVASRHLLLQERGGTVVAFDVTTQGKLAPPFILPPNRVVPLGREHSLTRLSVAGAVTATRRCREELPTTEPPRCIAVGLGNDARRLAFTDRPLTVGSAPDNDLVLRDPEVSSHHCRVEPAGQSVILRDLRTEGGTWVQGVRVLVAELHAGARWRVGRTDLQLLPSLVSASHTAAPTPAMQQVAERTQRYASLRWPVWIHGESGVGKDRIASDLHRLSRRSAGPWVAINAAALPESLLESELFGHEKGAFTGAAGLHRGVFEQAHGGTLFIDEIAELPLTMQSRLLRVLDHWELRRVGGEQAIAVDVRLVCATHRDLTAMVSAGSFRADLFYRLSQLIIEVPALRARDDLAQLAQNLLSELQTEVGPRQLSRAALARLLLHRWPGNIRELRNVLCNAAVESPATLLEAHDIEAALQRCAGVGTAVATDLVESSGSLQRVVQSCGGNLSAAARALGMARSTLRGRLLASCACAP